MTIKFEKFSRIDVILGTPSVRVTQKQLVFNSASFHEYLECFEFVELYFSKDAHVIGVKPVKKKTEDSFITRTYRAKKSPVTYVSCTRFLNHYGIFKTIGKVQSFLVEKDESGMLIIHLKR